MEVLKKYEGKKLFPLGKIYSVGYSNVGKTLIIRFSGDVPTAFEGGQIIIVHPDSESKGWVSPGEIGFILSGLNCKISIITLPEETVEMIKTIYEEYTGSPCSIRFKTGLYHTKGNDVSQFASPGYYRREILDSQS